MSKKLLSLVLAVAMVMSIFCVAFSTTAAADENDPTLTYYFLAPDNWTANGEKVSLYSCGPGWSPELAGWPGFEMTAAPEIGKNVYKASISVVGVMLIFNNKADDLGSIQTASFDASRDNTGKKNIGNSIFLITDLAAGEPPVAWYSLNPDDANYYRKSEAYAAYNISDDTTPTETPVMDNTLKAGDIGRGSEVDLSDTETQTISFTFEASNGFDDLTGMVFYVWDETNGGHYYGDELKWRTQNNWGLYQETEEDENGDPVIDPETGKEVKKFVNGVKNAAKGDDNRDVYKSIDIVIPKGHIVKLIVQGYDKNKDCPQTCDLLLTADADGDTLYITGNKLENPVDSAQFAIEAKFKNTDKCGPAKVITSTCKVVGVVLNENADPAQMVADKVYEYVAKPKIASPDAPENEKKDWTRENVAKVMADLGTNANDVWAAYVKANKIDEANLSAADKLAKDVINPTEKQDEDGLNTDDQGKKDDGKNTDDQGKKDDGKNTDDQGKKDDGKNTDDQGKKDDGKKTARIPTIRVRRTTARIPTTRVRRTTARIPTIRVRRTTARSPTTSPTTSRRQRRLFLVTLTKMDLSTPLTHL